MDRSAEKYQGNKSDRKIQEDDEMRDIEKAVKEEFNNSHFDYWVQNSQNNFEIDQIDKISNDYESDN